MFSTKPFKTYYERVSTLEKQSDVSQTLLSEAGGEQEDPEEASEVGYTKPWKSYWWMLHLLVAASYIAVFLLQEFPLQRQTFFDGSTHQDAMDQLFLTVNSSIKYSC